MDSYKMEHPMYEFLCEKKTHYKTRFSPYTHGMIDIQELRLYVNLILHTVSVFYKMVTLFHSFSRLSTATPNFSFNSFSCLRRHFTVRMVSVGVYSRASTSACNARIVRIALSTSV